MRNALLFVLIVSSALQTPADQISLKNGDRLTGAIVKSDGKTLTMKSEFAGTVSVVWDAVTAISSGEPLFLTLKDGQVVVGRVSTSDQRVVVETETAGRVVISKDAIQSIRSKEEQAAFEVETELLRNPRLRDLWSGFLDSGLALSRGNADTTTFSLAMNAARTTRRDKIAVTLSSLYGKSRTGGRSLTTANAVRGGISYDLNITNRTFAFGFTNLEFDEFQRLDLRFVGGGGLGWHVVKTEKMLFDLFGGGSLNKEFFSTGLSRTSGEVLFGQELNYRLSKATTLRDRLVLYPNLSIRGEYRVNFDFSVVTALSNWLGWNITISDRYLSNPLPGLKKNDLLLTTGIRLTFAKSGS